MPLDGLDGCADGCLDIPFAFAVPDKPGGCFALFGAVLMLGVLLIFQPQTTPPSPQPQIRATPQPVPTPGPSAIAPVDSKTRWQRLRNRAGDWMLRQGEEYIENKLKERREQREQQDQGK